MFAIRSLRSASGVEIGGMRFEHLKWTLMKDLPITVKAASEINPNDKGRATILEIIEVDSADDDRLKPHPVGANLSPISEPAPEPAPKPELEHEQKAQASEPAPKPDLEQEQATQAPEPGGGESEPEQ